MARKKKEKKNDAAEQPVDGEAAPKKRSKKRLILLVAIALGLGAGGLLLQPGKADGDEAAATTTTTTVPGPVVALDPITLNVPGDHYLRVGLALQMAAPTDGEAVPVEDEDVNPKVTHAPVLDAAIDVLGGRAYDELVTPAGRETAKAALVERMKERYAGRLEDIYFTEFVLQ